MGKDVGIESLQGFFCIKFKDIIKIILRFNCCIFWYDKVSDLRFQNLPIFRIPNFSLFLSVCCEKLQISYIEPCGALEVI